jgi:hypothetical protein
LRGEYVLDLLDEVLAFGEGRGQQRRTLKIFAALATAVALLMTWDASCERSVRS